MAIHNVESDGTASLHASDARPPFLVMQYVAGESLQARIDRQGQLALREILRIAHQTASGLAAAHAQGLVHRDVKPSNILLEQGVERALLTDFGLARAADDASLTHTGYMPGTPHYMSPEQARGEGVDARSDLFSLGSVMYAMCTGRPPFRAETTFGVLRRITDDEPRPIGEVNSEIPAWLAGLIEKLLAKRSEDRIGSAQEFAAILEQCLAHVQQPATVPLPNVCRASPPWRSASRRRRSIALVMGATGLAVLVTAGLAAFYFRTPQPSHNPPAGYEPSAPPRAPADWDDQSPSLLEWNAEAAVLESLMSDVDVFEQRAGQLWDEPPQAVPTTANSQSNDFSPSETPP